MDVNHLIIFKKVADTGGFSSAATALGLPKSSVSQKVSQLERDLGVRLLHRTTRRVSLTEEGERVYESASRIVAETDDIAAFASHLDEEPSGLLRVTAPPDFGLYVISDVVPAFLKRYPRISLELDLSNRIVDLINEGFDLALRATSGPLRDSSLVAKSLGTTRLRLFGSPKLKGNALPRSVEDLREARTIWFPRPRQQPSWQLVEDGGKTLDVALSPVLRINDFNAIKQATVAGMGVALIPEMSCLRELARRELVMLLPEWGAAHATVFAVYPSRKYMPAKTRAFIEAMQAALAPNVTVTSEL